MASKHTTSIVDISEIEDDEAPLNSADHHSALEQNHHNHNRPASLHQHSRQQQQQVGSGSGYGGATLGHQGRSASSTLAAPSGQQASTSPSPSAHLYLFHEDLHPHQRIPNLLSSIINAPSQPPQAAPTSSSATQLAHGHHLGANNPVSPGQTMLRPSSGLPAIAYHSMGGDDIYTQTADNKHYQQAGEPDYVTPATNNNEPNKRPTTPGPELEKANLGTLSGVYFPCVQNIFGVILFIRMVWIVGTAGVPAAFALVFICCCVTLTTSISLSAIATNGIVPAGGSYFMISRSLGPECGGAVGTMFWFGTTVAGAMYITGAVEIMLNYLAPSWGLFGDFQRDVSIMYNNIRVYGSILLILVGLMVWIGVKFVSKLAPIALFCVLFSIFSIYAGIFINYDGRQDLMICVMGDKLVTLKNMPYDEMVGGFDEQLQLSNIRNTSANNNNNNNNSNNSNKLSPAEQASQFQLRRTKALCSYEKLRYIYCPNELSTQQQPFSGDNNNNNPNYQDNQDNQAGNEQQQQQQQQTLETPEKRMFRDLFKRPPNMSNCDPYFKANRDRIHLEKAVPGIASGVLFQNLKPRFRTKRTFVSYDDGVNTNEKNDFNNVFVDITTSFTILISIYFPSCTGILAGSNRSGDLADAQKSIPRGTIAAQLTTSFVYLSCIVLFGSTFNNLFIRDKFGESMGGQLAVTQIAWPHPYIILIGGLLSTLGASLQSLVGAPRILQGIAKDEVIPCFSRFSKVSPRGEPETAIIFTLAISWLAVLIGNLDFIAPILTLSLVMCYFFINLACTLHSLLGSPNWRPRFRHYHWSISTLGCLLCLFVMIVSSWIYFLVAIFVASCIYKYIEFSGAEKEWGDGKQGLALSAARYNLLRLKTSEPHTKNWRPQVLLFCKLKPGAELEPRSAQANKRLIHGQLALTAAGSHTTTTNKVTSTSVSANQPETDSLKLAHPKLLTFASQLKAGKGLTLVSSIIEGDFKRLAPSAARARATLQESMQEERVKGFADVLVAPSIMDGLSYQIQTAGLGGLKHNTVIVGWPTHWRRPLTSGTARGQTAAAAAANANAAPTIDGGDSTTDDKLRGSFKLKQQQQQAEHASGPTTSGCGPSANKQPDGLARTRAHLFIDLMRNVQVSQNSFLVMKGVDNWPESCDKLGGFIDIWWIVNDGGLLMLLPHLLKQHRTWKSCQLRIFTVAQATDNSMQMREDLSKFLYHLRIEAQVEIVEMHNTEISDYAYERTLMMEQRGEIIKRLNVNRKQSLLLEQEVDGRVIRFRIRKPSASDFEDTIPIIGQQAGVASANNQHQQQAAIESGATDQYPMVDMQPHDPMSSSQAQSPIGGPPSQSGGVGGGGGNELGVGSEPAGGDPSNRSQQRHQSLLNNLRPDEANVRRMHTALTLNEAILKRSKAAKLVIINLPGAPKVSSPEAENNYMEFIEIITDKLERVLLVQNGGREVITIHS